MKEPKRLLDDALELDPDARLVLEVARAERPSAAARARLMAGIGAASSVSSLVATRAAAPEPARASSGISWKLAACGFAVVAVPALLLMSRPEATPAPVRKPAPVVQTPTVKPVELVAAAAPAAPSPEANPPQSAAEPALVAPAAANSARARVPSKPASLAEELAAIRAARAKLGAGDASGAIAALDDYARRFPDGKLRPEATVIRVEALVKRGDRASARSVAAPLLRDESPYSKRLHNLLGDDVKSP
jgi:hypothetical protein